MNQYDNLLQNYSDLKMQHRGTENDMTSGNNSRETSNLQNRVALNISDLSLQMNEISRQAIYDILADSTGLDLDLLATWYAKIPTLNADYSLVETYYHKGDYSLADAALNAVFSKHDLDAVQIEEHRNYNRFHALKNELQRSDRYWDVLTKGEIDELISIAEASDERSSTMAKGVLCFFYDICYEREIDFSVAMPATRSKSSSPTPSYFPTPLTSSEIQVFPNPTDGNLTIFIPELPEGSVVFQLFDVMGRSLLTQPLTDNSTTVNLSQLAQGMYYYHIMNNDIIIKSDKIVKR
jgi:hypothetical protein